MVLTKNFKRVYFNSFFKKDTKYISVPFFSTQLLIHIKNEWADSVCCLMVYSVPNLHTVPVHLSKKIDETRKKKKEKRKFFRFVNISLLFQHLLRAINQLPFLVIQNPSYLLKKHFLLPLASFHHQGRTFPGLAVAGIMPLERIT